MAIQLRHQTQQQHLPSAQSHGVGLPVSDGGLGAASQALGQVAGAAGQIGARLQRKEEKVKDTAVSTAYTTYETELGSLKDKADAAIKSRDFDLYAQIEQEIQSLDPKSKAFVGMNAFLPAQDKTIRFKDNDWDQAALRAQALYSSVEGDLHVASVNQRFFMQHSQGFETIQTKIDKDIQTGNIGAISLNESVGMMELFLAKTAEDVDLNPVVKEAAQKRMGNMMVTAIQGYAASREKFSTIQEYNKGLITAKEIIRGSPVFEQNRAEILEQIDSALLPEKEGSIRFTDQFRNNLNTLQSDVIATEKHLDQDTLSNSVQALDSYLALPNLSDADRNIATSAKGMLEIKTFMDQPEFHQDLTARLEADTDFDPLDLLRAYEGEANFASLRKDHRAALETGLSIRAETLLEAPLQGVVDQTSIASTGQKLDPITAAVNRNPQAQHHHKLARNAYAQAVTSFDPTNPSESLTFIQEAGQHLSAAMGPIDTTNLFPGLEFVKESLEKDPSPVNQHRNAQVLGLLWGKEKSSKFYSEFVSGEASDPMTVLSRSMAIGDGLSSYPDTHFYETVGIGTDPDTWLEKHKDTGVVGRYKEWETYTDSGVLELANPREGFWGSRADAFFPRTSHPTIAAVEQEMGLIDDTSQQLLLSYMRGQVMRLIKENPQMTVEEADSMAAKNILDKMDFVSDTKGHTQIHFEADRRDGSFKSPAWLRFQEITEPVARTVLNTIASPGVKTDRDISDRIYGGGATTKERYGEYRVQAMLLNAQDHHGLMENIMPALNPESELFKELGFADSDISKEEQLQMLIEKDLIREGGRVWKKGVLGRRIEFRWNKESTKPSMWQTLFGGREIIDTDWRPIPDIIIPESAMDVNERRVDEIESRLFKEAWGRRGAAAKRNFWGFIKGLDAVND